MTRLLRSLGVTGFAQRAKGFLRGPGPGAGFSRALAHVVVLALFWIFVIALIVVQAAHMIASSAGGKRIRSRNR